MTNVEKARQIAKELVGKLDDPLCSGIVEKSALYGALKMAEWKEQEIINKEIKQINYDNETENVNFISGKMFLENLI